MLETIKQVYFLMQIVCFQCCVLIFKGFYILGITVLCIDVSLSDFIFTDVWEEPSRRGMLQSNTPL